MLSIDDFKPIFLEDKPIFDKHYSKYPTVHSDNVFTTLVSWRDYADFKYLVFEDNLIIMSQTHGKIQIKPVSGKGDKTFFDQIIKLALGNKKIEVVVDAPAKEWVTNNYPQISFLTQRDYFDYVYLASDLAELAGSDYSKIRNRLNKFKRNFRYSVEEISENNISEINEFLKRWCLWKDCESDPILENEKKAILYSMKNFFDLKLSGISIRVNDAIEAIAVYEKMNPDTVVVHYEKGSPDYDGIYKVVNQETAKIIQEDFKYIDRESDMGVPGLRKAKMSYKPHHMIEVFALDKNSL